MKRRIISLVMAACLTLSIAACGNSGTSTTSDGEALSTEAVVGTAPNHDMVVAFNNDIQSLNPHNVGDSLSNTVIECVVEPLLNVDSDQNLVPKLAESWEMSEDGLSYTFHLRQGVAFSDGTPFNADAFMSNYNYAKENESIRSYRRVKDWTATAPDENTIVISIPEVNSGFYAGMTQFRIASPKTIEQGTNYMAKNIVGTGAYTFKEWSDGDHVTLLPNADYWDGAPQVDSLTFKNVKEDASRVAMLKTGEASVIYPVPPIEVDNLTSDSTLSVIEHPSNIMRYITLNMNDENLKDQRVRQAMNYAINKEAYIQTIFNGHAEEVYSCFPETVKYYSPQQPYSYDLEKAKELMKEAGLEDGFTMTMWGDDTTIEQQAMEFFRQQLQQINITVEVKSMDPTTRNDLINVSEDEATIDSWYVNWSASSFNTDEAMRNLLRSDNIPPTAYNTAYFKNTEFDTALDAALHSTDPAVIKENYDLAQQIVWEEAPWIFLGSDNVIAAQKNYVDGVVLLPDGGMQFNNASFK